MDYILIGRSEKLINTCYPNKDNFFNKDTLKLYTKTDLINNKDKIKDAKYVFATWNMIDLEKDEIKKYLPNLQAIFYAAGSVHYFAKPYLESNVRVFSGWKANAISVAEFTLAQILLANKGYFNIVNIYKNEGYKEAFDYGEKFKGNYKSTSVGLLGAGSIGKALIKLLSAFELNIKVYDPFLSDEEGKKLGVEKSALEDIFSNCDIISNHLALNTETENLIDYNLLSRMKNYSTFINTARGSIVNYKDFIKVFKTNDKILALLDVSDPYEPLEKDSELFSLKNVIITPHRAGACTSEIERLGDMMRETFIEFKKGVTSSNEIILEQLINLA